MEPHSKSHFVCKEENEQEEDGDEVGESEGEDSDNRDYDQVLLLIFHIMVK